MTHQIEGVNVWYDGWRHEEAMAKYQVYKVTGAFGCSEVKEQAPQQVSASQPADSCLVAKVEALSLENKELRQVTEDLQSAVKKLEQRIAAMETAGGAPAQEAAAEPAEEEDDDDFELFGSEDEEEDAEAERLKEERLAAYHAKKSKKPTVIAKSNIIFDVKPWDDETDMKEVEKLVRTIQMDGLLWGTSKLATVAFNIKKLVITCVIEDDKVSTQDLEDTITGFEDLVQSVDIAAFNKI